MCLEGLLRNNVLYVLMSTYSLQDSNHFEVWFTAQYR